jgi:undecaprenyl-diphosphatase
MIHWVQVLVLAIIQGAAELLPVSSSAHVIVAEKLMGLDPSSPEMTFLLVMLHTGTMFAVLFYFWKRWLEIFRTPGPAQRSFIRNLVLATVATGVVGVFLKAVLEKTLLPLLPSPSFGTIAPSQNDIEALFAYLPLIGVALAAAGILIWVAAKRDSARNENTEISSGSSLVIGAVQGLCLPFRGFSRSGATISTGLLRGISRARAEEFSFALAVILTPPVIAREFLRLHKVHAALGLGDALIPGFVGMIFSFIAGLFALKLLSAWLENGKWKYFGYYCLAASIVVLTLGFLGY